MTKSTVTPWWQTLRIRDELIEASGSIGDVQMSLKGVAYGNAGAYPAYADVAYFGEITHPSQSLRRIAADIAVRLAGEGGQAPSAKPVWRFDQGMGGGKSHALVALYHMATNPTEFASTDIGAAPWRTISSAEGSKPLRAASGRFSRRTNMVGTRWVLRMPRSWSTSSACASSHRGRMMSGAPFSWS